MTAERNVPIEESLIDACREVREMRAGNLTEPTLEDFFAEMAALIELGKVGAIRVGKASPA